MALSTREGFFHFFLPAGIRFGETLRLQFMRIRHLLFVTLLLPLISFRGERAPEEFIDWQAGQLLQWSDYRGAPDPVSDAAALTSTYLSIDFQMNNGAFGWKIQCRFSKPRSWVRSKSDYVLKHEQGHFDIAEIYARKLNKKLLEYQYNRATYQKDLQAIYTDLTNEKGSFQDLYDLETDHSRKPEEQLRWNKKIAELLEQLQDYSDYRSVTSSK
jgi:hypothetical protein